jgi:hypothetical protein
MKYLKEVLVVKLNDDDLNQKGIETLAHNISFTELSINKSEEATV